jgi:heat shock protein HslJ
MTQPLSLRLLAFCLIGIALPGLAAAADPNPNAKLRDTHWVVQTLDGKPVLAAAESPGLHLVLQARSQHLSGFAGCNRFRGRYTQRGTQIALKALGSTRMACPQMQQEQRFLELLAAVDAYRIEGSVLTLLEGDAVRVTFRTREPK